MDLWDLEKSLGSSVSVREKDAARDKFEHDLFRAANLYQASVDFVRRLAAAVEKRAAEETKANA